MNLFSPMLAYFGLGKLSNPDKGAQHGSANGTSTDAGINVTDERALQVSAVWDCTQKIVNAICSLPLDFYQKTADGREPLAESHYLNTLFNVSPNALMKPRDFRKAMTMQMVTWCNAYAEIFWDEAGTRPLAVVPLRPGRMVPVIDSEGGLVYHYQTDNGVRVYSQKSILHMKGFSTDGVVGLQRNEYARKSMGLSVSADVYAAKQFANDGRSGGDYLAFDTWLTPEQRAQARTLYGNMTETAFNKGKRTILEGGVKLVETGLNPDTMQMIQTRRMQVGEICRFYGVPEILIGGGDAKGAWPASFEQQLLSFLTFTLQDYLDEWETSLNYSLLQGADRQRIFADHDVAGFIKMDATTKAELQSKWVQNGLKTRNEVRIMNNDKPKPGGDDLTVQVNLTPVDALPGIVPTAPAAVEERDDKEVLALKSRVALMEIKNNEPATPMSQIFNIDLQPAAAPDVKVTTPITVPKAHVPDVKVVNKVSVPTQKMGDIVVPAPVVYVTNEVVPADVKIENNVTVPEREGKVVFQRDGNGNITTAELEE